MHSAHNHVHELPAVVPQPQLELEMRHFSWDGGGLTVQVYEAYIVLELKNDNIAVKMWIYATHSCCISADTSAMTAVLYSAKTWLQKKE